MNSNQTIAHHILLECGIDEVDDPKLHRLITEALTIQQQTHHHQLQKAHQDWLREEIVKLKGMIHEINTEDEYAKYDGQNKAIQTIIDRYDSELDQDKV